ncbi:MAG: glycosyltransferase, partial [Kiritimatiellae bacterium]|nr:glycosyltransferase [Kiritimatiellia bacterium]
MKVAVACGGTGGHAFPGLAVAEELVRRGHEVTVWESGRDIESSVMRRWSGPVFSTGARQLRLRNAFFNFASILRCRREMRRNRPDALLAMGSYSSLPPVLAARSRKVRICLHEANTVP